MLRKLFVTTVIATLLTTTTCPAKPPTIRCDANFDGTLNLIDCIRTLEYLFVGRPHSCPDVMDFNHDWSVDLTDVVALANYLFASGPPPFPAPVACP